MSGRICIIAGRGGSKRLPGKNLLPLCGKPLIAHTVEQAKLTGLFDEIIVTSDDEKILAVAQEYGATKTITRPPELATDEASSLDVIKHAATDCKTIVFLQITSPLRLPEDIKKAVEIFEQQPCGSLLSVVKQKCLNVELKPEPHFPQGFGEDIYNLNGSIYIWDVKRFLENPRHVYPDTKLMEMPAVRSVDIDYLADFKTAETLMQSGDYAKGESKEVV